MSLEDIAYVNRKLQWMEEQEIWPNGLRYLWTDAFGVVLYVSLYHKTGDASYLIKVEWLVEEVYRVLGRSKGLRIGEEADRDGQYFHYLAMWIYALTSLGKIKSEYRDEAIKLVKQIHSHFVIPEQGVIWKMQEDLSAPYPGYGLGAMDAFDGYVSYKLLDPDGLAGEIEDMQQLMTQSYKMLIINQDLGLGIMLWLCHFFPEEEWAEYQTRLSLHMLDRLWIDPPGYFCHQTGWKEIKFAFTNYGIALGLQAWDQWADRVEKLNGYFDEYKSGDEYDTNSITHVMACTSHFPSVFLKTRVSA
ncbi:MAG: hypothetical protein ACRESK_08325 [Gammaproteobacteria bacterium]